MQTELDSPDWNAREQELREAEWAARCSFLKLAQQIINARLHEGVGELSVGDAIKLIEASSKAGRLAIEGVEQPKQSGKPAEGSLEDFAAKLAQDLGVVLPPDLISPRL